MITRIKKERVAYFEIEVVYELVLSTPYLRIVEISKNYSSEEGSDYEFLKEEDRKWYEGLTEEQQDKFNNDVLEITIDLSSYSNINKIKDRNKS